MARSTKPGEVCCHDTPIVYGVTFNASFFLDVVLASAPASGKADSRLGTKALPAHRRLILNSSYHEYATTSQGRACPQLPSRLIYLYIDHSSREGFMLLDYAGQIADAVLECEAAEQCSSSRPQLEGS